MRKAIFIVLLAIMLTSTVGWGGDNQLPFDPCLTPEERIDK